MTSPAHDELVPERKARQELGGQSEMTFWRWDNGRSPAPPGWEPPIRINNRKFRTRRVIETVKNNLIQAALSTRAGKESPAG